MRTNIVLTLTGRDRIGIVEEITRLLLEHGANVETSRMARLGGEFALLALVSLPDERRTDLEAGLERLATQGFHVISSTTDTAEAHAGWLPYKIQVRGADHEGIIHEVARHLAEAGITIETMDTGATRAPMSGTPFFMMTAFVLVPPGLHDQDWEDALHDAAHRLDVDIQVSAAEQG